MNVVFLGCTLNFGRDHNASNTKVKLIADGLTNAGANCYIHAGLLGSNCTSFDDETVVDGLPCVDYVRRGAVGIGEIKNFKRLVKYLNDHKSSDGYNIGIVELPMLHTYILYCLALRKCGYRIFTISHEWAPTLHSTGINKLSNFLYSKTFGYLADGILPISEYIIEKIKHFRKPYLKVPALADFESFDEITPLSDYPYYLYCASAKYFRIVSWVINAFCEYRKAGGTYKLKMILSGNSQDLQRVSDYVSEKGIVDLCVMLSHLKYENLQANYKGASALLIPLDPETVQDSARFPQKIAEYTASKKPMITSAVGEVNVYFDSRSAYLATYDYISYANAMIKIEKDALKARETAEKAYSIGKENFDIKATGYKLYNFFKSQHS